MPDVLSQEEIDQLLKALDSGEIDVLEVEKEPERKIRTYDFKRPNKFSKDQIRTLNIIYEYYSRLLSTFFSGMLRTYCQVDMVSVEEQIFYEFANSIPNPTLLGVLKLDPMPGNTLMEVSTSVAYAIIERLLGGTGNEIIESRDFTDIEIALMKRILNHGVGLKKEAWSSIVDIEPGLEKIETNSRFMQMLSPNETVAIITLQARIGEVDGVINVCIPHLSIKSIEDQMSSKVWLSTADLIDSNYISEDVFIHNLKDSKLEVSAVLGNTIITAGEVLGLSEGDVIQLDSKIEDNIKILIGENLKFYGVPGILNNKQAVKITAMYDEEAEHE